MFDDVIDRGVYLKQLLDDFPDGVFTINTELRIKYANPAFCRLIGIAENELVGTPITRYLADLNILDACMASVAETGKCLHQETIFKRLDGSIIHISKSVQALYDRQGRISDILVSIRDMSELHALNRQLESSRRQIERYAENLETLVRERTRSLNEQMAFLAEYKKAVDSSSIVCKGSLRKRIDYVNQAFCGVSGFSGEELAGHPFTTTWRPESEAVIDTMWSKVSEGTPWRDIVPNAAKDGSIFFVDTTVAPIRDNSGSVKEYVSIGYDVSELVDKTRRLTERLYTDPLTRLPNRVKLLTDLSEIQSCLTLILLNVDGFKEINSFFGHQVGDATLEHLGRELLRFCDTIPLARLFKLPVDEYAILLKGKREHAFIENLVGDVYEAVSHKPFSFGGDEISLSVTVGISSCDEETHPEDRRKELLAHSDMALKLAKKLRKPYLFYDPSMHIREEYENNLIWIRRLRNAIDNNRVVNYYQPIFNARTLEIEKYESLVRVLDEDGGVILPGEFLNIAKRVKLYHHLTRQVFDMALKEFSDKPYSFSVNISIQDIVDGFMSAYIVNRVKTCSFADRIIFEILESEGIDNYDIVNDFIGEVKRYGAKIAIDDFGAGYSNFAYMMRLDIDFIKIDGSIIRDIDHNPHSRVITETIIDFASKLNISTIAEFVSNENVFEFMKSLPIDALQGFYLGEPSRTVG